MKRNRRMPRDPSKLARKIIDLATGQDEPDPDPDKDKDPKAVTRGRKGGAKGGPARAKKLSKDRRSAIARKAAKARWRR